MMICWCFGFVQLLLQQNYDSLSLWHKSHILLHPFGCGRVVKPAVRVWKKCDCTSWPSYSASRHSGEQPSCTLTARLGKSDGNTHHLLTDDTHHLLVDWYGWNTKVLILINASVHCQQNFKPMFPFIYFFLPKSSLNASFVGNRAAAKCSLPVCASLEVAECHGLPRARTQHGGKTSQPPAGGVTLFMSGNQ